MKWILFPFWLLYRIWFYVLVAIPIVVLFPVLVLSISKASWYPYFFRLARIWAKFILVGMGFLYRVKTDKTLVPGGSYMFIANHTSMIDIMLMLVAVPDNPFVFVGKKELARIPLFGFFYKRTCILVDRSDVKSRQAVFHKAQKRLNSGLSICIFPEGGVPEEHIDLDTFKDGAFRLAINHKIPVVPLVFLDAKKRFFYTFFSGGPGRMRILKLVPMDTAAMTLKDLPALKEDSHQLILQHLRAK